MGADEQMVRGGWFARLQGEVFRLGVPVGTDLSGLRDVCAFMCEAAGREAVDAATLFVTEREIAQALENWAGEEQKAGRLANWGRLCALAQDVRSAAAVTGAGEIRAVVNLPQDDAAPLPPQIARRVELVGRLIAPTQNTKLGPLHRLVAVLIQEAHEAGYQQGHQAMRLAGNVDPEVAAELVQLARRSPRGAMEAALRCVQLLGVTTREGSLAGLITARWAALKIWYGAVEDHDPVSPQDEAAPAGKDN